MAKRNFLIENEEGTKFKLQLDGQGNVCLTADGVEIFYIAEEDGRGYTMCIDPSDQEKLPSLAFSDDRLFIHS